MTAITVDSKTRQRLFEQAKNLNPQLGAIVQNEMKLTVEHLLEEVATIDFLTEELERYKQRLKEVFQQ